MRIAYVCRDSASDRQTGPAARVFATAQAMAHAGHDVYLVSEALHASRAQALLFAGSPAWVRVERNRLDHRYLVEAQGYADRVWDTLRALHVQSPLDVIEFTGAEGLTTIRAKRLLGDFPDTVLRVGESPEATAPETLLTFQTQLDAFAERYCVEHAGKVAPAEHQDGGLVSVVIPLYNQGGYVREAVESARAAGYPDLEIVVVDDGSTDPATISIFDALTGVVKVRQANRGLSAARNAGIAASTGRFVVPLDADDALPRGFLGPAVAALQRQPDLAYVVGYLRYVGLLNHVHVPLGYAGDISLILNTHGRATGVFRRDALLAVGGYDEDMPACEDWDLHIRLHKAGFDSDVMPVVGQVYRRHEDSMTFSQTGDVRVELLQLLLRKHSDLITPERALPLLLTMAHLWKTGFEPSASVQWQQRASSHG